MVKNIRNRNWFCRITKVNDTQNGIYEYDYNDLYQELTKRYDNIIFCIHDKDESNNHAHIVIQHKNPIKFDTLKRLMPYGNLSKQRGSNKEVYDYLLHQDEKSKKDGKVSYSPESIQTNIDDLESWKEIKQGKRSDLEECKLLAESGATFYEILDEYPHVIARYEKFIRMLIERYQKEVYGNSIRSLDVTYIYGKSRTGKTSYVYDKHGFQDVYRITNYQNPFDLYDGQPIILFEEFRSSLKITEILTLLEGYPTTLKARYNDKIACYTQVYIVSNISLIDQYPEVQVQSPETFNAFLNRFDKIIHFTDVGVYDTTYKSPQAINELMQAVIEKNKDKIVFYS